MIILDVEQGSPEWLAARCGLATASEFDSIQAKGKGITRAKYLARLAVERLRGSPLVNSYSSAAMKNGTEREPEAVALYEHRTKVWTTKVGFCRHDTLQIGASPDRLIDDDGALEVKCPELLAHLDYMDLPPGQAPTCYVAQVQGEMWICERRWCDFVSYCPDMPERLQLVIVRTCRATRLHRPARVRGRVFLDEVAAELAELQAMPGRIGVNDSFARVCFTDADAHAAALTRRSRSRGRSSPTARMR
jgi:hypothetical protein